MRTTLFLGVCLILLATLKWIPYQTKYRDFTTTDYSGSLPTPLPYTGICLIVFGVAVILTFYHNRKRLPAGLALVKKDEYLAPYYPPIRYWVIFMLTSFYFNPPFNLFRGIGFHFVFVIVGVLAYGFFCKWFYRHYQPNQLSLCNDTIVVRALLKTKTLKLDFIKALSYHKRQNYLTIHFTEGLDNIKLYLPEYDEAAIKALISEIRHQKGDTIEYEANFVRYFP